MEKIKGMKKKIQIITKLFFYPVKSDYEEEDVEEPEGVYFCAFDERLQRTPPPTGGYRAKCFSCEFHVKIHVANTCHFYA